MASPSVVTPDNSATWWARHRWPYNRALIVAGIAAFVCYAAVFEYRCIDVPGVEITAFTILFQGLVYLVAMGIANLCFNLGRWSEVFLQPKDRARFRQRVYALGFWFSVALPFSIPLLVLWRGCAPS